jgi:hypothetical protein
MNTHAILLIGTLVLSVPACGGVTEEKSLPDTGTDVDAEPPDDTAHDSESDAGDGPDTEPDADDEPDSESDANDEPDGPEPDCEPNCDPPISCETDADCPPDEGCDRSGEGPVCVPCPEGPTRWYPDCDLDTVGDSEAAVDSCFRPLALVLCEWVRTGGDCDDSNECCPNGRLTPTCNANAWRYACHEELGCLNTTTDEHCGEAYNACQPGSQCNEFEFIECRPTRCGDAICAAFDNIPVAHRETPATCPDDCN